MLKAALEELKKAFYAEHDEVVKINADLYKFAKSNLDSFHYMCDEFLKDVEAESKTDPADLKSLKSAIMNIKKILDFQIETITKDSEILCFMILDRYKRILEACLSTQDEELIAAILKHAVEKELEGARSNKEFAKFRLKGFAHFVQQVDLAIDSGDIFEVEQYLKDVFADQTKSSRQDEHQASS